MTHAPGTARCALSIAALVLLATSGCSARQGYAGGQAWLAEECRRTASEAQYQRCRDDATLGFEDYQRRRDGVDRPDTRNR